MAPVPGTVQHATLPPVRTAQNVAGESPSPSSAVAVSPDTVAVSAPTSREHVTTPLARRQHAWTPAAASSTASVTANSRRPPASFSHTIVEAVRQQILRTPSATSRTPLSTLLAGIVETPVPTWPQHQRLPPLV